jgi:hypothetical protein
LISPETWTLAVAVLTGTGLKESVARALIGRQCKEWEEADVVNAYEKASSKADPRGYAAGILHRTKKKARKVQDQLPLMAQEPPAKRETIEAALAASKRILGRRGGM